MAAGAGGQDVHSGYPVIEDHVGLAARDEQDDPLRHQDRTGAQGDPGVEIAVQSDREGAEEMASRLSKAGHEGQVVPHP